jgi:hypothetical protein
MVQYRVTIRYGQERPRYEVFDIEAGDLGEALRLAAESVPPEAAATAELAEVRRQVDPERREYTPG